jgi:hypothetical protein
MAIYSEKGHIFCTKAGSACNEDLTSKSEMISSDPEPIFIADTEN